MDAIVLLNVLDIVLFFSSVEGADWLVIQFVFFFLYLLEVNEHISLYYDVHDCNHNNRRCSKCCIIALRISGV